MYSICSTDCNQDNCKHSVSRITFFIRELMNWFFLLQNPCKFMCAAAAAPVVNWREYDTGYTERYLGLPETNRTAYGNSSVLNYIQHFPSEANRLLIVHGAIDENVHYRHTAMLINSLIMNCKPFVQITYPVERHGLRHTEASEHFETSLLHFFNSNANSCWCWYRICLIPSSSPIGKIDYSNRPIPSWIYLQRKWPLLIIHWLTDRKSQTRAQVIILMIIKPVMEIKWQRWNATADFKMQKGEPTSGSNRRLNFSLDSWEKNECFFSTCR